VVINPYYYIIADQNGVKNSLFFSVERHCYQHKEGTFFAPFQVVRFNATMLNQWGFVSIRLKSELGCLTKTYSSGLKSLDNISLISQLPIYWKIPFWKIAQGEYCPPPTV
jgi:hypothetical protein